MRPMPKRSARQSTGQTCGLSRPRRQSCLMLHRTRHLFIRQQTSVINATRAHLAEFGIVAPVGRKGVEDLLDVVADASDQGCGSRPRMPRSTTSPARARTGGGRGRQSRRSPSVEEGSVAGPADHVAIRDALEKKTPPTRAGQSLLETTILNFSIGPRPGLRSFRD